jgi:hypothetical protein
MAFGRRTDKRNNEDNVYRKKRKLKVQIRLLGVLILILGFLFSIAASQSHNSQNAIIVSLVFVLIGMVMILQKQGLKALGKKMTEPPHLVIVVSVLIVVEAIITGHMIRL